MAQIIQFFVTKKNTANLIATSNSDFYSVDTNDDEEDYFQNYELSTTDYEENDLTEDPIDSDKPSTSDAAQIETSLPSPISEVFIVSTKAPFFKC